MANREDVAGIYGIGSFELGHEKPLNFGVTIVVRGISLGFGSDSKYTLKGAQFL